MSADWYSFEPQGRTEVTLVSLDRPVRLGARATRSFKQHSSPGRTPPTSCATRSPGFRGLRRAGPGGRSRPVSPKARRPSRSRR
jgi:hypothetical protein